MQHLSPFTILKVSGFGEQNKVWNIRNKKGIYHIFTLFKVMEIFYLICIDPFLFRSPAAISVFYIPCLADHQPVTPHSAFSSELFKTKSSPDKSFIFYLLP